MGVALYSRSSSMCMTPFHSPDAEEALVSCGGAKVNAVGFKAGKEAAEGGGRRGAAAPLTAVTAAVSGVLTGDCTISCLASAVSGGSGSRCEKTDEKMDAGRLGTRPVATASLPGSTSGDGVSISSSSRPPLPCLRLSRSMMADRAAEMGDANEPTDEALEDESEQTDGGVAGTSSLPAPPRPLGDIGGVVGAVSDSLHSVAACSSASKVDTMASYRCACGSERRKRAFSVE